MRRGAERQQQVREWLRELARPDWRREAVETRLVSLPRAFRHRGRDVGRGEAIAVHVWSRCSARNHHQTGMGRRPDAQDTPHDDADRLTHSAGSTRAFVAVSRRSNRLRCLRAPAERISVRDVGSTGNRFVSPLPSERERTTQSHSFVGRMVERKRVALLIDALPACNRQCRR